MVYRLRSLPDDWTESDISQIANSVARVLRTQKPWLSESTVRDEAHKIYGQLERALREGRTEIHFEILVRYPKSLT